MIGHMRLFEEYIKELNIFIKGTEESITNGNYKCLEDYKYVCGRLHGARDCYKLLCSIDKAIKKQEMEQDY